MNRIMSFVLAVGAAVEFVRGFVTGDYVHFAIGWGMAACSLLYDLKADLNDQP